MVVCILRGDSFLFYEGGGFSFVVFGLISWCVGTTGESAT